MLRRARKAALDCLYYSQAQLADIGHFASFEGRYRLSALAFHLIYSGFEIGRYRILCSRQREVGQEPPAAI